MDGAQVEQAAWRARRYVFSVMAERGTAPDPAEIADALGLDPAETGAALDWLHDRHHLVLDVDRSVIMAHPFSNVETPFVVEARGRRWWANCAWDTFGILAAIRADGRGARGVAGRDFGAVRHGGCEEPAACGRARPNAGGRVRRRQPEGQPLREGWRLLHGNLHDGPEEQEWGGPPPLRAAGRGNGTGMVQEWRVSCKTDGRR